VGKRKTPADSGHRAREDEVSDTKPSDDLGEAIVTTKAANPDLNLDTLLASDEVDPVSRFMRNNRGRLAGIPEISEG
jgi:hypothetical protein